MRATDGIKDVFRVLANNRLVALTIAAMIFVLSALGQTAVEKITQALIPQLDETSQIISNQNKQFADVKQNLDKLSRSLSGADRDQLQALRDAIKVASNSSETTAARLGQLIEENNNLRAVLKAEKGIEGGVDLLIPLKDGYKIDASTSVGFTNLDGRGNAYLSLTSLNSTESATNIRLAIGEGIPFTNEADKKCRFTFLGASKADGGKVPLGKFALHCKGASQRQPAV